MYALKVTFPAIGELFDIVTRPKEPNITIGSYKVEFNENTIRAGCQLIKASDAVRCAKEVLALYEDCTFQRMLSFSIVTQNKKQLSDLIQEWAFKHGWRWCFTGVGIWPADGRTPNRIVFNPHEKHLESDTISDRREDEVSIEDAINYIVSPASNCMSVKLNDRFDIDVTTNKVLFSKEHECTKKVAIELGTYIVERYGKDEGA